MRTFTVNPQEGPARFPICQRLAFEEPLCSSTMSCLRNEVVVRRWVRGGEPLLNVLLQLVTYKTPSVTATKCEGKQQTFRLVYFV